MTTTPQHIPKSPDNRETGPDENSQAIRTAQSVTQPPIWEVIAEIGGLIPDDEWANVPSDASINLKHYLYGTPKKN